MATINVSKIDGEDDDYQRASTNKKTNTTPGNNLLFNAAAAHEFQSVVKQRNFGGDEGGE